MTTSNPPEHVLSHKLEIFTPNVSQFLLPDLIKILGWRDFGWDGAPFSSTQSCVSTWNRTSATVIFGISKLFRYFLMPVSIEIRHRYSFYIPEIKSNSPWVRENVVLTKCDASKVIKLAAFVFFFQLFFPLWLPVLIRLCYFSKEDFKKDSCCRGIKSSAAPSQMGMELQSAASAGPRRLLLLPP